MRLKRKAPPTPVETARLVLRPARMGDAEALFEVCGDPDVARFMTWDAHRSVRETRALVRRMIRAYRTAPPFFFVIELKEERRAVGMIGLVFYHERDRYAEVGYSLSRAYWNRGLMSEALRGMLAFCFATLGLNRVEAQHETENPASGAVMRRAGFRHEGTLRGRLFNKGLHHDMEQYGILKDQFTAQA